MFARFSRFQQEAGFSLAEILVSIFIITLVATAIIGALTYGVYASGAAGVRTRAILIADESLEITRNMRDQQFNNLTDGTYGLQLVGSQWNIISTPDVVDIFTRQITITTIDTNTKQITATVTWNQSARVRGTVSVATQLTNLALLNGQGLTINTGSASVGGAGNRDLLGVTFTNTGTSAVTIDTMTISWTNAQSLTQIVIGGSTVWSGTSSSGAVTNITNRTIAAGATDALTRLRFSGNMNNNTFTITLNMTDGSTKTVTVTQ